MTNPNQLVPVESVIDLASLRAHERSNAHWKSMRRKIGAVALMIVGVPLAASPDLRDTASDHARHIIEHVMPDGSYGPIYNEADLRYKQLNIEGNPHLFNNNDGTLPK
jgi:hypothetical protein